MNYNPRQIPSTFARFISCFREYSCLDLARKHCIWKLVSSSESFFYIFYISGSTCAEVYIAQDEVARIPNYGSVWHLSQCCRMGF